MSAGDLLRAEVKAGTPAGKRAQEYMDNGNLVPNDVVVEMVVNRLQQDDAQSQGWLLDGYPRSKEQVEAIEQAGIRPDVFILINVDVTLLFKSSPIFLLFPSLDSTDNLLSEPRSSDPIRCPAT